MAWILCASSASAHPNLQTGDDRANGGAGDLELIEVVARSPRVNRRDQAVTTSVVTTNQQPALRLDDVIAAIPGVGLFRRADSFSAHPTTQGLSLRGVGANAAGRVAVTLDGVPLNDPFGGWIYWSALDSASVARARVRRGGGLGSLGQGALAGAVALESADYNPDGLLRRDIEQSVDIRLGAGNRDHILASGRARLVSADGALSLSVGAGHEETDGFFIRRRADRGPVDRRASSQVSRADASLQARLGDRTAVTARLRWFREERLNGVQFAVNETDAVDVDLILRRDLEPGLLTASLFWRDRGFDNVFAAALDDRTTARPVLDQFDVPAQSGGFRLDLSAPLGTISGADITLDSGVEGRLMDGETNERFRNLGAGFTRQRLAGGQQWLLGGYADLYAETGGWSVTASARGDFWRVFDGARREFDIESPGQPVLRDDSIAPQSGFLASGRLAARYALSGAISIDAAIGQSFRLPTLNEYYRPFRVANDITEANAALRPERLTGLEAGFRYQPLSTVSVGARYFRSWLRDGVGNVTIGFGPGFFPLGGFVPEGGSLRQRANIDLVVTDGVEFEAAITLASHWQVDLRYQFADARVAQFDAQPGLIGLAPPQTPRHSLVAGLRYSADALSASLQLSYDADRFDDDQNQRPLPDVATIGARVDIPLAGDSVGLFLVAENILNAEVISALDGALVPTIAQRRQIVVGLSASF